MDREEAAFKWNLWSWTQTEILGGISTGELEATDKLDRSFFRIWETCRKEALNRSLVCSENLKATCWMACAFLWMDKSKSDLALKVTVNDNQIFKNWSLENISGHTNSVNVSDFFWNCSFRNISEPKVMSNINAGHTSHQWHCHHPYCLKRLSACLLWWLPHYWSLATSDPPQSWQSQWPTWIVCICIGLCLYL